MPKRHDPARKEEALRLLELHNFNVAIVHQLTNIPAKTLYYWRRQEFSNKTDFIAQKNIPPAIESVQQNDPPPHPYPTPPPDHPDTQLIQYDDLTCDRLPSHPVDNKLPAETSEPLPQFSAAEDCLPSHKSEPLESARQRVEAAESDPQNAYLDSFIAGVPGKTYPYPKEDDAAEAEIRWEEFRKVRDILMKHAHHLALNLRPDDPDINRRSLALSRILDRVEQLDDMLPDLNPEQVVRFEYVYGGMVHNKPPWMSDHLGPDERADLMARETSNEESSDADR